MNDDNQLFARIAPLFDVGLLGSASVLVAGCGSGGSQVALSKVWSEKGPGGEVLFACTPANPIVQSISARAGTNGGPVYVYARVRPELKTEAAKVFSDRAVFLLDTSLSEYPDRFQVSMKLLKSILEQDKDLESFNILTFNVGAAWVEPTVAFNSAPAGAA